jgi:hypothetical protein
MWPSSPQVYVVRVYVKLVLDPESMQDPTYVNICKHVANYLLAVRTLQAYTLAEVVIIL